ncbi:DUF1573 domain-containing protein [Geomesophilobacter sediminis]|uniref:DUF1573 domain-containing protein n=1 Tax=Geomesophilobacter sediminis TaxID=2798584 RepID=A0A8J7JL23_9BACT|nr:DUF1573 domain-containing protein [Geomesophilobacter sediminis]MBJ6724430.1 DUF1573 domain-containing protein [Geomesophilobacter sediminis]
MKPRTILLSLMSYLAVTATAIAAPEYSVDHGSYNFGTVTQGKKVQHSFTIKNNGDATLQIKQLTASCGCTAATPSASSIAPGKSAEIKVVFDSTNFSGKVQKTVAMTTNAGKNPNYTFTMEGIVAEELQATPRQISLGTMKAGVPREVTVTVRNNGSTMHRLISATANSNSLQITPKIPKQNIKPGESGTVELTIASRSEARILSGYLHIVTDNPQKKEITIPIYGSAAK